MDEKILTLLRNRNDGSDLVAWLEELNRGNPSDPFAELEGITMADAGEPSGSECDYSELFETIGTPTGSRNDYKRAHYDLRKARASGDPEAIAAAEAALKTGRPRKNKTRPTDPFERQILAKLDTWTSKQRKKGIEPTADQIEAQKVEIRERQHKKEEKNA